jgi:PAS domain S-box-containing protein
MENSERREDLAATLLATGFRGTVARDLRDALELCTLHPPSVILLEWLPTGRGVEAVEQLSQTTPHTPIIAIGHISPEEAIDALKHGAYDVLPTPHEKAELLNAIHRAQGRHHLLRENTRLIHALQEQVEKLSELYRRADDFAKDLEHRVQTSTAELYRSQRLMESILTHMASGLLVTDMIGAVTMINPQGTLTLRCEGRELIGKKLIELFPNAGNLLEVQERSQHRELQIRLRDGSIIPLGFSSSYLTDPQGNREGVIVVFRDLSDIKRLQEELFRKNRLAAMGQVVAAVAHEIRNPLFGITSVAQILQREVEFTEAHQELMQAMLSETQRLNALVSDLLLFGRPARIERRMTELHQLLDEGCHLYAEELRQRSIRLEKAYHPRLPPIAVDGDRLKQVFLNLMKNALEATPPGGLITIGTRMLPAGLKEQEGVEVFFADTGCGISAEDRERIFDLFFTTKPRGSGLGLPICRRIVEDHGGEIKVMTRVGEGAIFTVWLPLV